MIISEAFEWPITIKIINIDLATDIDSCVAYLDFKEKLSLVLDVNLSSKPSY